MSLSKGGAITLAGQWVKYGVQLVALILLSRLLEPSQVGTFALAAALFGFANVLTDSGLSLSGVQAKSLSRTARANLWWINVAAAISMALVLAALSPLAADVFHAPELVGLMSTLSLALVANGAAIQVRVELNRDHRFSTLAGIDIASQAVGLTVALVAAVLGAGAYALVAQQVAAAILNLCLSISLARWRLARPGRDGSTMPVLRLGMSTLGTQLINYLSVSVPPLVLGSAGATAQVGYWNRAYQLFSMPSQQLVSPLTRVVLPALAHADGADSSRRIRQFQLVLGYTVIGVLVYVAVAAQPLVDLLLGPQWAAVGPLLQVLLVGAFFQVMSYSCYWLALAGARMKALMLAELPGRILSVALVAISATFNPDYVAWGFSAGLALVWIGAIVVIPRRVNVSILNLIQPMLRPLVMWLVAGAACTALMHWMDNLPSIVAILAAAGVFIAVLVSAAGLRSVRADYAALLVLLTRALRTKGES